MAYSDVDSGFIDYFKRNNVFPTRRFWIGNSDYSQYVTKWPKLTRKWNEIKPQNTTIEVANATQAFNFIKDNPAHMMAQCRVEVGRVWTVGSETMLDLFVGNINKINFNRTKASINLIDKFKTFTERTVGIDDAPVDYTNSDYLPSDIIWEVITCYGGLSAVQSDSNVDVDYPSYLSWAEVFSSDTVLMQGYFTGQKVAEILKVAGRATGSSIFEEEGKIKFARFRTNSEEPFEIGAVVDVRMDLNDARVINKKIVKAGYNVDSSAFSIITSEVNTASVNSFNAREDIEDSDILWYTTSGSALNFIQRELSVNAFPYEKFTIKTPFYSLGRSIGDTVNFTGGPLGVGGETYRIMSYDMDVDKALMTITVDATQLLLLA